MKSRLIGKKCDTQNILYKKKLRGLSPQARTIPTERPPLVGEVIANFSGEVIQLRPASKDFKIVCKSMKYC
jgi:hypothetical protein